MKFSHASMAIAGLAGLALLGACNKAAAPAASDSTGEVAATPPEEAAAPVEALLANGLTAEATVELRQTHLKAVGKAFKTIYEQSNAGSPDMAAIQAAIASLPAEVDGFETWFPDGSGPESGVKTDALAAIWENRADFDEKAAALKPAVDALVLAGETGELTAIGAAFRETGSVCKSCHDKYRKDD